MSHFSLSFLSLSLPLCSSSYPYPHPLQVPAFLEWLNNLGEKEENDVLYRETSAQHWNYSDTGYFESSWDQRQAMANGSCIPIYDSTPGR